MKLDFLDEVKAFFCFEFIESVFIIAIIVLPGSS